ncbi:uncharacterized protein BCR38DRAFT_73705 [Pseudomassariella vexata]|uniref:Secreted protein n=1 Tax=Pseudomassariella vexata TaxID=1141098 RepID=A0A1Y2DGV2_9PEZI|nr:uncharacterized protein BCR38DRAFT_73705 [Pseudomassariella vexata]ORY58491.1 hypothetical protein BCR38DRAFT_73705 [Pseudomassariella vexata]
MIGLQSLRMLLVGRVCYCLSILAHELIVTPRPPHRSRVRHRAPARTIYHASANCSSFICLLAERIAGCFGEIGRVGISAEQKFFRRKAVSVSFHLTGMDAGVEPNLWVLDARCSAPVKANTRRYREHALEKFEQMCIEWGRC